MAKKVAEVLDQLKAGKIVVSAEKGDLIKTVWGLGYKSSPEVSDGGQN